MYSSERYMVAEEGAVDSLYNNTSQTSAFFRLLSLFFETIRDLYGDRLYCPPRSRLLLLPLLQSLMML